MSKNIKCERLMDYYNGHLNDVEKYAFEKHLRECPECRDEIQMLEELNADLVNGIEMIEPPAEMKNRILGSIFDEDDKQDNTLHGKNDNKKLNKVKKERNYKLWIMPLAALLLLSVIGNIYLYNLQPDSASISQSLFDDSEATPLSPASNDLNMDAKMAMHSDENGQTLVLEAHNFTNHQAGDVYQVWLLKDNNPYRAGTLVPNEHGEGYVVFSLEDAESINWDAVAITLEQSPHSPVPEGDILMSAEF